MMSSIFDRRRTRRIIKLREDAEKESSRIIKKKQSLRTINIDNISQRNLKNKNNR